MADDEAPDDGAPDDGATDDLEARLGAAAGALREHQLTARRCAELEARAAALAPRVSALRSELAAERQDVERLEGLSLARVLASLRGAREDRLARQQAEADVAALRVQEAEAQLAAVQRELAAAQERWQALSGAPAAYGAVLGEKERHLRASGDPRGRRVMELADERGRLAGELREIDEALRAAAVAHTAVVQVRDHLGRASGWSTYDTFFGGGLISSSIKLDKMDQAAAAATRADQHLLVLRSELADIGRAALSAPRLTVPGLTRFVDVWFDNIFTDWDVRNRIEDAKYNVDFCLQLIERLQAQLADRTSQIRARFSVLAAERQALLTGSPEAPGSAPSSGRHPNC